MKVKWRKLSHVVLFALINPHLLLMLPFAVVINLVHRGLFVISDFFDCMARIVASIDKSLGRIDWPRWGEKLLDEED